VLRRFRLDDLPEFVAYRSCAQVARFQSWDAPYSRGPGLVAIRAAGKRNLEGEHDAGQPTASRTLPASARTPKLSGSARREVRMSLTGRHLNFRNALIISGIEPHELQEQRITIESVSTYYHFNLFRIVAF
jgi:hypothetical protein